MTDELIVLVQYNNLDDTKHGLGVSLGSHSTKQMNESYLSVKTIMTTEEEEVIK